MNITLGKLLLLAVVPAALFASGIAVRRVVLNAQYDCYGRPMPFDLESALNFRYIRMLVETGKAPALDKYVQYPQGVIVRQTYEAGAEYICAFLSKFFPASVPLDERVRWISVVWFCLGIPALFFWIWRWQDSISGAAFGAAFYAVSLAGVIRSTGQEISHENFALPLLIAHFAVGSFAERKGLSLREFVCLSLLSALLLAGALMLWDLIQFFIIIWAGLGCFRVVKGEYFKEFKYRIKWGLVLAVLVLAGFTNPYLRAHGFVYSPAILLACGVLLAMPMAARAGAGGENRIFRNIKLPYMFLRICLVLLPLCVGLCLFRKYALAYGHFTDLIWAKIIFLNAKPSDPSLLTFAQRILWVPALNSANLLLTKTLFPVSLPLFLVSAVIFLFGRCRPIDPEIRNRKSKIQNSLFNPRWRTDPELTELLFFGFMSLIAFVLFVRLHVFAAIAFSASIGLLAAWAARRRNILVRVLLILILLGGVSVEAANVLRDPLRWGSGQPYLAERKELVRWLKTNAAGQPVLANFGISAFVLAYAGCPVILHPKFESAEIRKRVQEYGEMLFKSNEEQFRGWAGKYGAAFYIYSRGEFADFCPEAQMRYCVNALNPPPDAAARLFEFNPSASRWFKLLWQDRKYRVFRIITRADELTAEGMVNLARVKMKTGGFEEAQQEAEHALLYDPENKKAIDAIVEIDALRQTERAKAKRGNEKK